MRLIGLLWLPRPVSSRRVARAPEQVHKQLLKKMLHTVRAAMTCLPRLIRPDCRALYSSRCVFADRHNSPVWTERTLQPIRFGLIAI